MSLRGDGERPIGVGDRPLLLVVDECGPRIGDGERDLERLRRRP